MGVVACIALHVSSLNVSLSPNETCPFACLRATCAGVDSALVPLGASYMRIRAFAQPAVLLTMVCQAGLLAQQVRVLGGVLPCAAG